MAEAYQNLGQASPAANTPTALFTVPAATSYIVATLQVCNTGAGQAQFSVQHAVAGAASSTAQYLYYNANLAPSASVSITIGLTAAATDVLRVSATAAGVTFNAFGTAVS